MNLLAEQGQDERILILMPTAKDADRTRDALAKVRLAGFVCRDLDDLCRQILIGGGVALLTEDLLAGTRFERLLAVLRQQPAWSDFPLIILAREAAEERSDTFPPEMNVTLVERPLRIRSLISVIQASLRSRRHQYRVRHHLAERDFQTQALKENRARLLFALGAGRLGSWELDVASNELQCSEICKINFGRSPTAPFNYQEFWLSIHPEDRKHVRSAVERTLNDRADLDVEYRTIWPDDSVHWMLMRGRVYRGQESLLRMSGVCLDITSQKEAEAELRSAHRRKDEFLALLAHELRNPLAPLQNACHVMRLARQGSETFEHAIAIMERQLTHMVRLIDDLLDISRITQDKMELRRSKTLLADIISVAVETAHPAIKAAGHELTIELPEEPIFLDADLTRLAQVFANLLSNSAKYTTRSGGHIWLTAERRREQVIVSVRDNGIGIPPASLSTIFDMFSQVDRSIERTSGGLGIGLALVKGLVEMHGGSVTAKSDGPDAGSTFAVRLTCAPPPEPGTVTESATTERVRRKILVTDDNRDSANTMAMMLRLQGHDVRTAYDGLEAVKLAESDPPELILMDIGMPQLNGYEATRIIRQQPSSQNIVIIALSGWGQDADREKSKEAGCNGHLVKPVDAKHLAKVLSTLQTHSGCETAP